MAASSFDARHSGLRHSTARAIKGIDTKPKDYLLQHHFSRSIKDLFRNRYYVPEKAAGPPKRFAQRERAAAAPAAKGVWRLEDSIWAGRQYRSGENRGFFDDDTIVRRAIVCDFRKAIAKGLLLPYLLKHDANAPRSDASSEEIEAFVSEIEEVLVSHGRLFFMVFDYFASLSGTNDLFHIGRNGYDEMCKQCGLIVKGSKACDLAHLDIIFAQVNATELVVAANDKKAKKDSKGGGSAKATPKHDSKHTLTRAELIQCLCRIAVARYILTPKTAKTPKAGKTDVSDSVEELFRTIRAQASREVQQDGQAFRRSSCYLEATDMALRLHEPALRLLFTKYSAGEGVVGDDGPGRSGSQKSKSVVLVADSDKLMSPGEWICLCRDLALIGDDLSMDDARLIFMWSRMRVIDEDSKNRERIENLTVCPPSCKSSSCPCALTRMSSN